MERIYEYEVPRNEDKEDDRRGGNGTTTIITPIYMGFSRDEDRKWCEGYERSNIV